MPQSDSICDAGQDAAFMRIAMEEARLAANEGEVPIGAVVVHKGILIARAHNAVERLLQGSAHAELLVLQEASRRLAAWRLDDCTLYVTKEPCPMCAGAMVNCRLPRLVFGCHDPRGGAAGGFLQITAMPGALHTVQVTPGVLADECLAIIQDFFRQRRKKDAKKTTDAAEQQELSQKQTEQEQKIAQ